MNSIQNHLRVAAFCLAGAFMLSTQLGNGCESTPRDSDYPRRDDDRYDYDYDKDQYHIPEDARLVTEGRGTLRFRAGSNGRMWLYDERDRKVLYSTNLLEGDDVRVDAEADRVFVNDRSVSKMSISGSHDLRIYFDGRRAYGGGGGWGGGGYDRPQRPDPRPEQRPEPARPVPDSAKVMAEGRGVDLSFKADDDGRAYLYDATNNTLVQTFNVRKNQRLSVSPKNDLATLDGKTVMQHRGLNSRRTYKLLFNRN